MHIDRKKLGELIDELPDDRFDCSPYEEEVESPLDEVDPFVSFTSMVSDRMNARRYVGPGPWLDVLRSPRK